MRRRRDAPGSVMDLLFVTMIERFRIDGQQGMNLGLAPQVAATGNAPRFMRWQAAFAMSWDNVKQFRLVRIMTSSFVQTVPGIGAASSYLIE